MFVICYFKGRECHFAQSISHQLFLSLNPRVTYKIQATFHMQSLKTKQISSALIFSFPLLRVDSIQMMHQPK